MADKVRIGIIGVGMIGKHHLNQYKDIPEAEVVAICDNREDELASVSQQFGIAATYADYNELLKREDIECVDVCVHNRRHTPVAVAALKAGKNVYCEKPMSWTYADAKSMYDVAQATGRMLHVQLSTLYSADARAAKRLIDDGHLGHIYYAKSSWYRRRGRPYVDGYGRMPFVQMDEGGSGGGAMLDIAVYHIGRMMWLLDNPGLISVSGSIFQMLENMYRDRREASGYGVEEFGSALIRLEGGITFMMEEAWAIQSERTGTEYVNGSKAGLRVEPLAFYTTLSDIEMDATFDTKQADWRWHQCIANTAGYDNSQRHWIWAQLGRVPLLDTAGIALKTSLITEGIYLSSHLGREVTVREILATTPDYRLS